MLAAGLVLTGIDEHYPDDRTLARRPELADHRRKPPLLVVRARKPEQRATTRLLAREIEWEIVPAALDVGLGLLPWSPLGGGWLSGKYRRDQRPAGATRLGEDPGRGMEAYDRRGTDRTWRVIDAVQGIAEESGVTMAEAALAWVTARPAVSSTVLGARTISQLQVNLRSADLHLTAAQTAALDAASDPRPADYPYGELGVEQRARSLPADNSSGTATGASTFRQSPTARS